MLDRQCSSSELNSETSVPNSSGESPAPATNSMKRPIPAPRSAASKLSKELLKSAENATLKSYNPNRKLKRNRNSRLVDIKTRIPIKLYNFITINL